MHRILFHIAIALGLILGTSIHARAATSQDACEDTATKAGTQYLTSFSIQYGLSGCRILSYHIEYLPQPTSCFDKAVVLHVFCSTGGNHSLAVPVCESTPGCPVGQPYFYGMKSDN